MLKYSKTERLFLPKERTKKGLQVATSCPHQSTTIQLVCRQRYKGLEPATSSLEDHIGGGVNSQMDAEFLKAFTGLKVVGL